MMFTNLSFDELNALVTNERSLPYETYFGEMTLPEEEKTERIKMAEDLEEVFITTMIWLFTLEQANNTNYEPVRQRMEDDYMEVLRKYVEVDNYLKTYVKSFSYDVIDSTKKHKNDPYYYSLDRARFMAENEVNTAINHARYIEAVNAGKTMKRWESIIDEVTRKDHIEINGKYIPIGQAFHVGDSWMLFPKDTSLGASANQIVNCRCAVIYF
ncbi:phage minor head protein [Mediterraneibacter faecis]|uniref:phage minor head protein n=1 Tax=Mediterraneibacter faecis TaxID=592978 RepID=UPI003F94663F